MKSMTDEESKSLWTPLTIDWYKSAAIGWYWTCWDGYSWSLVAKTRWRRKGDATMNLRTRRCCLRNARVVFFLDDHSCWSFSLSFGEKFLFFFFWNSVSLWCWLRMSLESEIFKEGLKFEALKWRRNLSLIFGQLY